jgi:DnaK suppressor protein
MVTKIDTIEGVAKARLAARKTELEAILKDLVGASEHREAIRIESVADPADWERSRTERDIALQQLEQENHLHHEVTLALVRLQEHVYGTCEMCERRISEQRLDAVPWARLCFACQSKNEAAEHFRAPHLKHTA